MSDYVIIAPPHLGSGEQGAARKAALEQLAAEAGCYYNGQPSIGKYLVKLADERILKMEKERKLTMNEILQSIYENGRVTSDSTREELEGEFEFEARDQDWDDDEIKEAINSPWFPAAR